MTAEPVRTHNWDDLAPDMQAAVERTVAKVRPGPQGWDPERCRHLAALLGLRPRPLTAEGRASDA